MTQIGILEGIYADAGGDFRTAMPTNLEPVVLETGISKGHLRTSPGIAAFGDAGPGRDRGGIVWTDRHVRVMGTRLVTISPGGTISNIGPVGMGGPVSFDYSFDRLAIAAGGDLFYYDGAGVAQVIDSDLGGVIDVVWIDGYFMTTDGTHLVVTELNDPTSVNPIKYGSSEEDPDPITGLMKQHGEVHAINRHTIEPFQNIGGAGFPFQRIPQGLIEKGCIGAKAKAYIADTYAFVGSGKNEALSIYLAGMGEAIPIATPEIDQILAAEDPDRLDEVECETRSDRNEQRLIVHLPSGRTLAYHVKASIAAQTPVWTNLASGTQAEQPYPLRHLVNYRSEWIGGSVTGNLGRLDYSSGSHFGEPAGWSFDTRLIYNEARGGIIRALELVGLPGRAPLGVSPTVYFSWTRDGSSWSQERGVSMGLTGQTQKRMAWRPGVRFANYMGLRFRGANNAIGGFARLDAMIEGLSA